MKPLKSNATNVEKLRLYKFVLSVNGMDRAGYVKHVLKIMNVVGK